MSFASERSLETETIEIVETLASTGISFFCQNFGAKRGIKASDSNTNSKGQERMVISNAFIEKLV